MDAIANVFGEFSGALSFISGALPFLLFLPAILLAVILIPIFMVRGYKRGLWLSLVSLGASLIAYFLSVFLTKPIAALISRKIYDAVSVNLTNTGSAGVEKLQSLESARVLATALITYAVAAILFIFVFLLILLVLKIVTGCTLKSLLYKENTPTGMKIGGMCIRLLDAILLSILFFVPVFAVIGTGAGTVARITEPTAAAERETGTSGDEKLNDDAIEKVSAAHGIARAVLNSPGVALSGRSFIGFSRSIFPSFTYGGSSHNAADLIEDASSSFGTAVEIALMGPERISDAQEKIDGFVSWFVFDDFNAQLTVEAAGIAGEFAAEDGKNEIPDTVLSMLKESSVKDVNDAVAALGAAAKDLIAEKVPFTTKDRQKLFDAFKNEQLVGAISKDVRSSSLLSRMADYLMTEGLTALGEKDDGEIIGGSMEPVYRRIRDKIKSDPIKSEKQILDEATALKKMISSLSALFGSTEEFKELDLRSIDAKALSEFMIGAALHPYIGEETVNVFISDVLPTIDKENSSLINSSMTKSFKDALSDDLRAIGQGRSYGALENLIRSFKDLALAVDSMKKADRSQSAKYVEDLMKGMTKESASAIKEILSGDVFETIAGSSNNTEATREFISDLIGNIADNDNTEKDSKAVIELTTVALNYQEHPDGKSLAEAVGGDLKEFFETVASSDLIVKTARESVARSGSDPLDGFAGVSEYDKDDAVYACEQILIEHGGDLQMKENLNSILAFMGLGALK